MSATRKSNENLERLVDSITKAILKYGPESDVSKNVKEFINTSMRISNDYAAQAEVSNSLIQAQANATKAFNAKDLKTFGEALKIEYPLFSQYEKIKSASTNKGYDDISKLLQPLINKIPAELTDTAKKLEKEVLDIKSLVVGKDAKIKSDHLLLMTVAGKLNQMKANKAGGTAEASSSNSKTASGPLFKPAPTAATTQSTPQIIPSAKKY